MEEKDVEHYREFVNSVVKSPERFDFFTDIQESTSESTLIQEGHSDGSIPGFYNDLEELGLAYHHGWKYGLNASGLALYDALLQAFQRAQLAEETQPFFQELAPYPGKELVPVYDEFGSCEVVVPKERDSRNPWREYRNLIKGADEMRELVPWLTGYSDLIVEEVVENGMETDFIVDPGLAEAELETSENRTLIEKAQETGRAQYHVCGESLPKFTLSLFDDETTAISAKDDELVIIITQSPEIRDWAEELYAKYSAVIDRDF